MNFLTSKDWCPYKCRDYSSICRGTVGKWHSLMPFLNVVSRYSDTTPNRLLQEVKKTSYFQIPKEIIIPNRLPKVYLQIFRPSRCFCKVFSTSYSFRKFKLGIEIENLVNFVNSLLRDYRITTSNKGFKPQRNSPQ